MIEFVAEAGSTNADLAARLKAGEALQEGHWLVADRQIEGKGRQGRDWVDGEGNFMGSTFIRLTRSDKNISCLPLLAGLAVYEAVLARMAWPAQLELKWPNDVTLAGGKLAGILLERFDDTMIVGIGVNLAKAPIVPGRKIISLGQLGPAPDRDGFARDLARHMSEEVSRWRAQGAVSVVARWLAVAHRPGTPLTVHAHDGQSINGTFDGLAADGALRLRLADGSLRVIHVGDVSREGS